MDIEYRALGRVDAPMLMNAGQDVFDHASRADSVEAFLSDPRHHIVAAILADRIVGFVSAVNYVHPDKSPELWINEVAVAPEHRRRGVGRRMMTTMLDVGRRLGCSNAWVLTDDANAAAVALYRAAGGILASVPALMFEFDLTSGMPSDPVTRTEAARLTMATSDAEAWEQRLAHAWASIERCEPDAFVAQIEALAAELPPESAIGYFERASAQDSTGHPDRAVPLYRAALRAGLGGLRRRRATIQLASSLRNLGDAGEAASLLERELDAPSDELDDAVRAFLALALADLGREREAVALSLGALSGYLPRYNRSLRNYATALGGSPRDPSRAGEPEQGSAE
jgi:GNAT superfamily N-acetyltransferase